ncbi:MAG TPA: bacteriohemerythrin [Geothrix sp.]|jgi:hemerythrin-like metal-binding protein
MAYMEWRAALEIGHAKIDSEHRSLVDALNRLHAAMKQGKGRDEIERILLFLKDYTVEHFQGEERLMMAHGYPGTAMHCAIHADLVKQVGDLITGYRSGKTVLTSAVLDFLEAWLVKHIQGEDTALGAFLKEKDAVA